MLSFSSKRTQAGAKKLNRTLVQTGSVCAVYAIIFNHKSLFSFVALATAKHIGDFLSGLGATCLVAVSLLSLMQVRRVGL